MSVLYALLAFVYLGWVFIGLPEFLSSGDTVFMTFALLFTFLPIAIFIFEEISHDR